MINTNLERFSSIYKEELKNATINYPQEYTYGVDRVAEVHNRMMIAIANKSFNKDSKAVKATCKKLGIKHTYTAIYEFLGV